MFCEHANENPNICKCDLKCECNISHCKGKDYYQPIYAMFGVSTTSYLVGYLKLKRV